MHAGLQKGAYQNSILNKFSEKQILNAQNTFHQYLNKQS